jgi:hypothetical protein
MIFAIRKFGAVRDFRFRITEALRELFSQQLLHYCKLLIHCQPTSVEL